MDKTTRHLEFKDDKSSKFWEIARVGESVTVRYGKTGTIGQSQTKVFANDSAAAKHLEKLIAEKVGKGYAELGAKLIPIAYTGNADAVQQTAAPKVKRTVTTASAKSAKQKNPLQDPEATPESLLALLDKDDVTNRQLAKHQRASAELLEKLSHSSDKATRQAVTGNPNTPLETFVRLGQQFPKEFLANPALDLLLMVNPALMDEVPDSLLIRLLKQADCPESLLTWAAAQRREKVQLAVAMNASAPEQALQRLRESKHEAVRESVKVKPGATLEQEPEQVFEQAVRERLGSLKPNELIEAWSSGDIGLEQWSALPVTFRLVKSASDGFSPEGIVRGLHRTGRTFETFQEICFNYLDGAVLEHVASSPSTPVLVLEQLYKKYLFTYRTWRALGANPSTPSHVLEALSKSHDSGDRAAVAENTATPVPLLEVLSRDSSKYVRGAVAINPSSPLPLLEVLAKDSDGWVRWSVAQNLFAPVPTLVVLSNDADRSVRTSVGGNPLTPLAVLMFLSEDSESSVRDAVAGNSLTPVSVLEEFSRESKSSARCVAQNTSVPSSILVILSKNPDKFVRCAVAANPSTPLHVLEDLSKDSEQWVRRNVAANPATPPLILERLGADVSSDVKVAVIGNPNTPLPVLLKLVSFKTVSVRQALAAQAHRSPEIRKTLWKDANDAVRRAVASCMGLGQEVLDEMVQETELESDLASLFGHPNLGAKSVEYIADKLLNTPATSSAWYQRELAKASAEVRAAAQADAVLSYHGKDPNKAVLAKRPLAPVMALCAGPFIEPTRLARVVGSTDWLVRAAVARNPGTPPNMLKKLSADAHLLVAALAKRAQVGSAEPASSSTDSPTQNIDISRAVVETLDRIRKTAANKPKLLLESVFDLVWGDQMGIEDLLTTLPWMGIMNLVVPQIRTKLDRELRSLVWEMGSKAFDPVVRRNLALNPECPEDVIRILVRDESTDVLLAALSSPVFSPEERALIIQNLLKLRGSKLMDVLANPRVPWEILEAQATNSDPRVRCKVAEKPSTPSHVLELLAKDTSNYVRGGVAENPSTPVSVLDLLAKDSDAFVRSKVVSNPITPVSFLEVLSKDSDIDIRMSLVGNASTPLHVQTRLLEKLARSRDKWVRQEVSARKVSPPQVLEILSKDKDDAVRSAVAGNPSTPLMVLEALSKDTNHDVRRIVATNTFTPARVLADLSKDADALYAVASNPSTSVSILEVFAKDSESSVRGCVGSNPATPTPVLEALAKDPSWDVRRNVAANPSAPKRSLEALSKDSNFEVRRGVARNPSTPNHVLSSLASEGTWQMLSAIVFNPASSLEVREQSVQHWTTRIQRAAERETSIREGTVPSPQVPISPADLIRALNWLECIPSDADNKALTKASRSKDWLTRLGVALHPSASNGILKLLQQDSDPDVAIATRMRMAANNESAT